MLINKENRELLYCKINFNSATFLMRLVLNINNLALHERHFSYKWGCFVWSYFEYIGERRSKWRNCWMAFLCCGMWIN